MYIFIYYFIFFKLLKINFSNEYLFMYYSYKIIDKLTFDIIQYYLICDALSQL